MRSGDQYTGAIVWPRNAFIKAGLAANFCFQLRHQSTSCQNVDTAGCNSRFWPSFIYNSSAVKAVSKITRGNLIVDTDGHKSGKTDIDRVAIKKYAQRFGEHRADAQCRK
jgi:hypothetical protein